MKSATVQREVTLILPMLPDMEIAASMAAMTVATSMKMSADRVDEVRMAVVEACINSFEHSGSPDRKVRVHIQVLGESAPEKLRISISDSGSGFQPGAIEDPNIEDKLGSERKRGWGLKIIRNLMDSVEIESGPNGTTVVMSKSR